MNNQQTYDLAVQRHRAGQLPQAEALYRRVLSADPNHADALHYLGSIVHQLGRHELAAELISKALTIKPDYPDAYVNLGSALGALGQVDDAITAYRKAIALRPTSPDAHNNLGNSLMQKGQRAEAIAAFRRTISIKPNYAHAFSNLGNALKNDGQPAEAIEAYRQAIRLNPKYPPAYSNLGALLRNMGQSDDAIALYHQALALRPDYAKAWSNLGGALQDQGRLDEAIAAFRRAIAAEPGFHQAHSNLVYAMHYHPAYDAQAIAKEHGAWNRRHAQPLQQLIQPHRNDRDSERRLRIGYVSPDLRNHPVGRFLLPLLQHHNRGQFEVFAYAQVPYPDALTQELRSRTDAWRDTVGQSDDALADQIRRDRIDILVDLAMHTANNRLLVFARKPAPVQVSYLAYCSSTGLETIDYRLSDPFLDPVENPDGGSGTPATAPARETSIYSEQTVLLPQTYWCYQPHGTAPEVNPPPASTHGIVTFGCLNNFAKVSEPAIRCWILLLQSVPTARLLLHAREGSHRERLAERFKRAGIGERRVQFVANVPADEYFRLYHQIDIALDTFPYGGGTTTLDALWMGVAVVSLTGNTAVGRGGVSILSNLGLPELVARSHEQYIRIAIDLAGDPARLAELRSTLRRRMQNSPLMDAPRWAGHIETTYRQMWRTWCQGS